MTLLGEAVGAVFATLVLENLLPREADMSGAPAADLNSGGERSKANLPSAELPGKADGCADLPVEDEL